MLVEVAMNKDIRMKMLDFTPALKGVQAFLAFAPFRAGVNKERQCFIAT